MLPFKRASVSMANLLDASKNVLKFFEIPLHNCNKIQNILKFNKKNTRKSEV